VCDEVVGRRGPIAGMMKCSDTEKDADNDFLHAKATGISKDRC
jgi:hypothetical protein